MEIVTYADAVRFLERVGPTLEREEAKHSLLLGIASSFENRAYELEGAPLFATVETRGTWSLAALMTPPFPLILAAADENATTDCAPLARHLQHAGHPVPGVTATPRLAERFARQWEQLSGERRESEMRQRIYRLEQLDLTPQSPSLLRRATESDVALVGRWLGEFQAEAIHDEDRERARQMALRRIDRAEIYLWDDGQPRCMAGRSRPTRHTVTVNAVYTPPEFRRAGYATAAVAALSQLLLGEGYRACVLYTDLANPTSNRIYQRIGYRAVCDSVRYAFGSCP